MSSLISQFSASSAPSITPETAEIASRPTMSRKTKEERDIRVDDYLNDKLQNSVDLATIDTLLDEVKAQQLLLQQQVNTQDHILSHEKHS